MISLGMSKVYLLSKYRMCQGTCPHLTLKSTLMTSNKAIMYFSHSFLACLEIVVGSKLGCRSRAYFIVEI